MGGSGKGFLLLKETQKEIFSFLPWNIAGSGCASGTTAAMLPPGGG